MLGGGLDACDYCEWLFTGGYILSYQPPASREITCLFTMSKVFD